MFLTSQRSRSDAMINWSRSAPFVGLNLKDRRQSSARPPLAAAATSGISPASFFSIPERVRLNCWIWGGFVAYLWDLLFLTEQRTCQHLRGLLPREDHHHHRLHGLRLQGVHHDHPQAGGGESCKHAVRPKDRRADGWKSSFPHQVVKAPATKLAHS